MASQLGTRPVSTPIPRQEWAETLSAILAPEAGRAVLAPDARRAVCVGAIEEHGRRILELVISDEIANMEFEITLQMYHEHVERLDKRMHEFRQRQELP